MFFDSWNSLLRIIIVGTAAYLVLLVFLRVSGKRTLSKMNAFDFVVTVALGSTLATILLSKRTPLAEGVVALGLLIFFQFVITWLSVRSATVRRLVKAEPRLLVHRGDLLPAALKSERVTEEEILQALRNQGVSSLGNAAAVVLETDGTLTVLQSPPGDPAASTLDNVRKG